MLVALLSLKGGFHPAVLRESALLFIAIVFSALMAAQVLHVAWPALGLRLGSDARWAVALRGTVYAMMILSVVIFDREAQTFVYFQF